MRSLYCAIVAALCLPVLLNSCYFNSTARLYDKAEYEARANAADLNMMPNPVVYQNGASYYIELPRYRVGNPLKIQHSLFEQEMPVTGWTEKRGMGMFRIPQDFALYLAGRGREVKSVSFLEEVPQADEIKLLSRPIPVVRKAEAHVVNYTYTSPDAGWLRTVAPLNWIFVDLPVTVVENVAVLTAAAGGVWLFMEDEEEEDEEEPVICPPPSL